MSKKWIVLTEDMLRIVAQWRSEKKTWKEISKSFQNINDMQLYHACRHLPVANGEMLTESVQSQLPIDKMGIAHKERKGKPTKKVVQFDLAGKFLRVWDSARKATEGLGIPPDKIATKENKITLCCRYEEVGDTQGRFSCAGFQWRYLSQFADWIPGNISPKVEKRGRPSNAIKSSQTQDIPDVILPEPVMPEPFPLIQEEVLPEPESLKAASWFEAIQMIGTNEEAMEIMKRVNSRLSTWSIEAKQFNTTGGVLRYAILKMLGDKFEMTNRGKKRKNTARSTMFVLWILCIIAIVGFLVLK